MAIDKGGRSALALSREFGLRYGTAWLLHHKIQPAMADRNARCQAWWNWTTPILAE